MLKTSPNMFRVSRHTAMMQTAEVWARRSTCFRRNVGAVISSNNRIVSIGYNGAPPGEPHCLGATCVPPGETGCTRAIHAEINALDYLPSSISAPLTLYVTESPCLACAAKISACALITKVYYLNEYRLRHGITHLIDNCIHVYRMTPSGYLIDQKTGELVS